MAEGAAATAPVGGRPTVLVTGATGFVGRYLVPLLMHRGYAVRGTFREEALPRDFPTDMEWVRLPDIGPETQWQESLDGVEYVIHLAGLAHRFSGGENSTVEEYWRVNSHGTRRLAQEVRAASHVRRLVFLSSVGAVCSLSDAVVTHETEPRPDTHYGRSKGAAEVALAETLAEGEADWCVLRSPLVYGPGNPGNMGRLVRLINRGVPLPLASVSNRRSFIFIGNLGDVLERCLHHPGASRHTFLVSDGEDVSTAELVRRLSEHADRPVRIFPMPGRMLRGLGRLGDVVGPLVGRSVGLSTYSVDRLMGSLQIDAQRVRSFLEWDPPFALDEGLAQTLKARPPEFPGRGAWQWEVVWGQGAPFRPHRPEGGSPTGGRTLVTGARGFVAPHVLKALVRGGISARGLVRTVDPSNREPWRVEGVEYVAGDLAQRPALGEALKGVDTVIHLAGRAHVLDEWDDASRDLFFQANVEGTRNLLEESLAAGVDRFLFLSSVKALGEVGTEGRWTDDTPANPLGPYGESKLGAEQVIRSLAGKTGLHAPILRLPIVYGPGVKANLLRLFELVTRGVPLPLGRVENQRSLLYVENAVAAMEAVLLCPGSACRTYLVSDLEDVSTPELVRRIGRAVRRRARVMPVPVGLFRLGGRAGDAISHVVPSPLTSSVVDRLVGSLSVNASAIVEEAGYAPPFSLDEGLRRTGEWFRSAHGG